jgi:molybdate transport system substrate-binding protein
MQQTRRTRTARGAVALALAIGLAACGSSSKDSGNGDRGELSGSIQVFMASSLNPAFTAFAEEFQAAHAGTEITLNPGSSTTLAEQIQSGADADVYASADTKNMDNLQAADLVGGDPILFAKNQMEIAVEPGNPKQIKALADLENKNLIVVLCVSEAPCGKYADQLIEQNDLTITPKSREIDVATTLAKVESGDADAALVYVTDVKDAGDGVDGVTIPTEQNVVATYPIAPLSDSGNAALAHAWVDFVTAPAQEQRLQDEFGFLPAS